MKIGLLTNKEDSYFCRQFAKELSEFDSKAILQIIKPSKCALELENSKPQLLYDNQTLKEIDYYIPRILPRSMSFDFEIIKHIEHTGQRLINNTKTFEHSKNRFSAMQHLKRLEDIKVPKSLLIKNRKQLKNTLDENFELPVMLKTLSARPRGLDSIYIDNLKNAELFLDINFMFESFFKRDQGIIIQEYLPQNPNISNHCVIIAGQIEECFSQQKYILGDKNFDPRHKEFKRLELSENDKNQMIKIAKTFNMDFGLISYIETQESKYFYNVNPVFDPEKYEKDYGLNIISRLIRSCIFH